MLVPRLLSLFVMIVSLSGCTSDALQSRGGRGGTPIRCEDIVAEGHATSERQARLIAKAGITQQLPDARGNLLALKLRHIRGAGYETRCRPHTLGLGLINCTTVARLCGR